MSMSIKSLYRYPIKGLSAEPLERVELTRGEGVPQDRRFAIARSDRSFDPQRPEWVHKSKFVMLMQDEKLALLKSQFNEATGCISIQYEGGPSFSANLTESQGREALARFIGEFMGDLLAEQPRIVEAPGHRFFDASPKPGATTDKYVSLVNLASIRALEDIVGRPLDPVRFRANVYFDGAAAWHEQDWMGSVIRLGGARLRAIAPITRCAATAVEPKTAVRDLDIPMILRKSFGHVHMGIYAEVVASGSMALGDEIRLS